MKQTPNINLPILEQGDKYLKETQNEAFSVIDREIAGLNSAISVLDNVEGSIVDTKNDVETLKNETNTLKASLNDMASNVIPNIQTSLDNIEKKQDYIIYLKKYKVPNKGDITQAFKEAISDVLTSNGKYRKIIFPEGEYYIGDISINLENLVSTTLIDAYSLSIEGASSKSTKLIVKDSATFGFHLVTGTFAISNLTIDGNSKKAFILGESFISQSGDLQVCKQTTFNDVNIFYANIGIEFRHCFDSSFYDCSVMWLKGDNGVALDFKGISHDNHNNINFIRCHVEGTYGENSTFVRIRKAGVGATRNINFLNSHFETRKRNTLLFDGEECSLIYFKGCQIQNSDTHSLPAASLNNVFKINNCRNICIENSQLNQVNNTEFKEIFKLIGKNTVFIKNSDIVLGGNLPSHSPTSKIYDKTEATNDVELNFIVEQCGFVDLNSVPVNGVSNKISTLRGTNINYFEIGDNNGCVSKKVSTNRGFLNPVEVERISPNGYKGVSVLSGLTTKQIEKDTSELIAVSTSGNTNRRGIYIISVDVPNNPSIILSSDGNNLYPLTTNDNVFSVNTDSVSDKFNLKLESGKLRIYNLYGSDRKIMVLPIMFPDF